MNQEKGSPSHLHNPRNSKRIVECVSQSSTNSKRHQSLLDAPEYKLSLIIPAYNEEKRLKSMLYNALAVLKSKTGADQGYSCEVILVDDGSKDKTVDEYHNLVATFGKFQQIDFKLIKLEKNSGKGFAVSEVNIQLLISIF